MPPYTPPLFFRNGHIQSIYPTVFRRVNEICYRRERIDTPDDDFLDLDWLAGDDERPLVIIAHGLEGNSRRAYVKGMARAFFKAGFSVLAWNFRGCGGEINRRPKLYHSGFYEDLETVLMHAYASGYESICLCGFSMGGNVNLLYLGLMGEAVDNRVKACVTFSVPCDLATGSRRIAAPGNRIYMKRFLRLLHEKIKAKKERWPALFDDHNYHLIQDFKGFDDRYTAPLHGFADAEDYWRRASCKPQLKNVQVPTLLVNALDDPFLPKECFPYRQAAENPFLKLETPRHGGHVGFVQFNRSGTYWSEARALSFCSGLLAD